MKMKNSKSSQLGFTLLEVVIVAGITIILAGGMLSLQYIFGQTQISVLRNYTSVEQANSGISEMVRELRNLQVAENGAYPLQEAQDQEIIFYSDYDFDGTSERIRYYLSGTQFTKGVIEPTGFPPTYPSANEKTKVISDSVRNAATPIFYYYNGDWPSDTTNNPLDTPTRLSETKLMRLNIIINPTTNTNHDFTLDSYVQLRSLKQNL
jgi:type II secretory pathway pseudopilin PulG